MATQLSPEILARLAQLSPQALQPFLNQGGQQYTPLYDVTSSGGDGSSSDMSFNRTGYAMGDPYKAGGGGSYSKYDLSGADTGQTGQWQTDDWNYDNYALMAAALGIGGFAAMAGGLGSGAAGAANGMWDVLPEAVGGAPNTAVMGAGGGSAMSAGAGEQAFPWASQGFTDTGTAGGALDAGYAGSGAVTGAGGMALPSGGGSGLGQYLGPASTLLGGLAGAQGQNKTGTETKEPWLPLQPFLKDSLIPATRGLLESQLQYVPAQAKQIGQQAMGLLQQPMAGNGVGLFNSKYHFGG